MKKQFKILLAGYGDIARRAAGLLSQNGYQLFGLRRTRLDPGNDPVTMVFEDLRDSSRLAAVLEQRFDVVVISMTPEAFSDEGYKNSYVAAAASFATAVKRVSCPPGLVIWVSSTGVYGQHRGEWVDESSATKPETFSGKRLLEAERKIASVAESGPIKPIVVRFSGIYGPGRNRLLEQVKRGRLVGADQPIWSNRIHSMDCAGVLVHLIERQLQGAPLFDLYLATDRLPVPMYEVQAWLAERLGVERQQTVAASGRANRRVSSRRLIESGYVFQYPTYREGYAALLDEPQRQ